MRELQQNYSADVEEMYNQEGRLRKAATMHKVLAEASAVPLGDLSLINVGGSAGIIDEYLSAYFSKIYSIDIDRSAQAITASRIDKANMQFLACDAMNICFADNSIDVAVCSQVYEHVPNAQRMMDEIHRVLKPGGICYFSGSNRFMWNEPHYNLKLLSAIPRPLAHRYMKLAGKGNYYHEKHYSYWGLKKLMRRFTVEDYTARIVSVPQRYSADYMIPAAGIKNILYRLFCRCCYWFMPGYIWVLRK